MRVVLSPRSSVMLGFAHLVAAAAWIGAALVLLAYVQLLHDAVDRGARLRAQALPKPDAALVAQRGERPDQRLRPVLAIGALPATER
ncbi:MAG TPA: hypothetical protein VNU71_13960 [Burkholderiaceae bacterium]|nr:hypothetical protein [Burkholderiaceae bacterium]